MNQSQQSPPPKWTDAPDYPRISTPTCTLSLNVPQVERFVLDTEPPAGTIPPCTMADPPDKTNTTGDHILKPRTRSVARATLLTIPESVPLSESDEDEVGDDSSKVYVFPLPYGAYKPPFVNKIDSSEPINLTYMLQQTRNILLFPHKCRSLQAQVHRSRRISQEFTSSATKG